MAKKSGLHPADQEALNQKLRFHKKVEGVLGRVSATLEKMERKLQNDIAERKHNAPLAATQPQIARSADRPAATLQHEAPASEFASYPDFKSKIRAEGVRRTGLIRFTYLGSAVPERSVELIASYPRGYPSYILGHCSLRKEERTFALSKVVSPHDLLADKPIQELGLWLQTPR